MFKNFQFKLTGSHFTSILDLFHDGNLLESLKKLAYHPGSTYTYQR